MRKLKTILSFDSGYFIHSGIFLSLFLIAVDHPIVWIIFIAEGLYLWSHFRRLFFLGVGFVLLAAVSVLLQSMVTLSESTVEMCGSVGTVSADHFEFTDGAKRILVYYDNETDPEAVLPGDEITITGTVMKQSGYVIEHGFSNQKYVRSMGYCASFYANRLKISGHHFHPDILRYRIQQYLRNVFSEEVAGMLLYTLLGNDDYVDEDTTNAIEKLGVSHLFAISGMNIALIVAFLDHLFKRLFLQRGVKEGLIAFVLILYCVLTGFSVSVLRAVSLVLCVTSRDFLKLPLSRIDIMGFILSFFLIINPFYGYSLSFKLSFLIAFSIVIGQELLKTQRPLTSILKMGLYANLVALPILLEINQEWNPLSIPANLGFVMFVEKILFPFSFLTVFIPSFGELYQYLVLWFSETVRFLAQIDWVIVFNFPSDLAKLLYFAFLFLVFYRIETKKNCLIPTGAILFLILFLYTFPSIPGETYVKVFDVGQGDAIFIHEPNADVLIDTGNQDAYDTLIRYFRGENIHHLDYIIITHPDSDHCGELSDLLESLKVDRVISGTPLDDVPQSQMAIYSKGMTIECGNLSLLVLNSSSIELEDNDDSLVLYGIIGNQSWLFMGDAGVSVEKAICDEFSLTADIVKIGHHGSDTATSDLFLNELSPQIAIVSVGENNSYHHPALSVMNRLQKKDIEIYRTDECGTLTFFYPPIVSFGALLKEKRDSLFSKEGSRFLRFL